MAKMSGLGKGLDAIFLENESESPDSTVTLSLDDIEPNRGQPRTDFDPQALNALADSIRENGVLQPILVRPILGGGYQIVAGERRYRASRLAGLREIPAIVRELSDHKTMELALIENLQRENLSPIEEAKGYETLQTTYDMTQEQIAEAMGKSRPAIANALRLLRLPEEVQQMVRDEKLTAGHARALSSIEDAQQVIKIANEIADKNLSVRETESLLKPKKEKKASAKPTEASQKLVIYKEVEMALTEHLGRKVTVKKNGKGGLLTLEFYSIGELMDLANKLEEK
ncbi:MAG: ParB/RepB/Spo0J family partition protein [Eubacteriales bacterium]|nr:ParB/RepB/Spo0J family partition protein [Eubacteriales bacterium]